MEYIDSYSGRNVGVDVESTNEKFQHNLKKIFQNIQLSQKKILKKQYYKYIILYRKVLSGVFDHIKDRLENINDTNSKKNEDKDFLKKEIFNTIEDNIKDIELIEEHIGDELYKINNDIEKENNILQKLYKT
jgi:hypothetical protein